LTVLVFLRCQRTTS